MMKLQKRLLFLSALVATSLVACNNGGPKPEPDNHVDVFVLSGQSNMEGSTYFVHPDGTPLLQNYFEEEGMDYTGVSEGIPTVKTSYYGFYYPNGWARAHTASQDTSTPEARLTPNFQPTKVGMGVADEVENPKDRSKKVKDIFFGPELGIAYKIAEAASEENPVHLVKCAFSGSGFTKADGANWTKRDEDPTKSLFYLLKTYTHNCLEAIEETGKVPVLKASYGIKANLMVVTLSMKNTQEHSLVISVKNSRTMLLMKIQTKSPLLIAPSMMARASVK